ncbi:hypothetical protein ACFSKW_26880 [Nonomuraea mangrovi]|uniref:Uncharacterized protein n=1 Tax=Nonomuraea mangrovi TaxID=2316207 RepID=A0ABW4T1I5_9ACTN
MPGKFTRGFDAQAPRDPEREQFTTYQHHSDDPEVCPRNPLPSIVTGGHRRGICYHDEPTCEVLKATLSLAELCGAPGYPTPVPYTSTDRLTPCPRCVLGTIPVAIWEAKTKDGWRQGDLLERWRHPAGAWAAVVYVFGATPPFAAIYAEDELRRFPQG